MNAVNRETRIGINTKRLRRLTTTSCWLREPAYTF
jgi:hypothetical protein